jgi:methyltransferase-like protein 27
VRHRARRRRGAGRRPPGRIVGIDLSPASLAVARERAVYDELAEADLQRPLPFGPDSFDGALCVGVLSYVPDTVSIWRELARVVRPGGIVVCTQRADVWDERGCDAVLDELEREGTWTVLHLSAPADYMPGNADFGHAIGVRYLAAHPLLIAPSGRRRSVNRRGDRRRARGAGRC